jgi:hypothetical protein
MALQHIVDTMTERRRKHVANDHRDTIDTLYEAVRDGAMSWQLATLVADILGPADWRIEAACQGAPLDWFYPEQGQSTADARALCADCPVRADCQAYADVCEKHGIWAGVSALRRHKADPNRKCDECAVPLGRTLRRFCDDCRTARRLRQQADSRARRGEAQPWIGSA